VSARKKKYRPLVSVIMNCYNGEPFLAEALESVRRQTYDHWEIVFWDNASTDGSGAIAGAFGPKLRYFRGKKNVPLGEARNFALAEARGELIAFLDCDDLWFANRLARGVEVLGDPQWAMCYAGVEEITREGKRLRRILPEHASGRILGGLLRSFDINIPTILVRREVLQRHGLGFDPTYFASEEFNLFTRLAAREPIATIPEYLACWRCHSGSLTGKTISRWADERERTLDQLLREMPELRERYRAEFDEAYARARYYRACHYVDQGRMRDARREIAAVKSASFKYRFLYWLSYFPKQGWETFHHPWIKRVFVPRLLRLLEG
jgi:glycosyltransferase involved in cell wall biosynthesis